MKSMFSFTISLGCGISGVVEKPTSSVPLVVDRICSFCAKAGNTNNGIKNKIYRNFNNKLFSN